MQSHASLIALATVGILAAGQANAQTVDFGGKKITFQNYGDAEKASLYQYDTSVPAAPALGMVENAPELSFTSPFGPDLVKDVIVSENIGASIAARPYWALGYGRRLSPTAYEAKDPFWRILARTSASAAAAPRVVEDQTGLGAAIGLSTEFFDVADPRMNDAHLLCIGDTGAEWATSANALKDGFDTDPVALAAAKKAALTALGVPSEPSIDGATRIRDIGNGQPMAVREAVSQFVNQKLRDLGEANEPAFKDAIARCFKRAKLAVENSPSLQAATGFGWASDTYDLGRLQGTGARAWLAVRIPLFPHRACRDKTIKTKDVRLPDDADSAGPVCLPPPGNLTAFAHHIDDDHTSIGGTEREARTSQGGLVLSHTAPNQNWSASASAVWNQRDFKAAGIATDKFERYAVSLSTNVFGNFWVEANFGQTEGLSTSKDESYGLVRVILK